MSDPMSFSSCEAFPPFKTKSNILDIFAKWCFFPDQGESSLLPDQVAKGLDELCVYIKCKLVGHSTDEAQFFQWRTICWLTVYKSLGGRKPLAAAAVLYSFALLCPQHLKCCYINTAFVERDTTHIYNVCALCCFASFSQVCSRDLSKSNCLQHVVYVLKLPHSFSKQMSIRATFLHSHLTLQKD